jgi:ribosomal protein S18 acetylase RimI-like enzyme
MDPDQTDAAPVEDPLAGVPELKSYVTEDEEEKVAALKLVADSVAQMRQAANSALLFHPLNISVGVAIISLLARYVYEWRRDVTVAATTCTGLVMICLAFCRYATQSYITAAEAINLQWMGNADVIITKFGDEIIGTVMIDWVTGESRQRRKKPLRGEIIGWAVRLRYRKKGVGSALLEEAVKESRKKGAETIEFAEDHASKSILDTYARKSADSNCFRFETSTTEVVQWTDGQTREASARVVAGSSGNKSSQNKAEAWW